MSPTIERSMLRINTTLKNMQADHQTYMVEIECMLKEKVISILIYPGEILSYVSPIIVDLCKLQQNNFENSWLVQLAMGT